MDTGGTAMKNADKYGASVRSKTAGFRRGFGQCVINIKNSVKSLFKARLEWSFPTWLCSTQSLEWAKVKKSDPIESLAVVSHSSLGCDNEASGYEKSRN